MNRHFNRAVWCAWILLTVSPEPTVGQIVNGSFESGGGSFAGWNTFGQASIEDATFTPAPAGAYQALARTAGVADNAAELSAFFGGVTLPPNQNGAATDGSGFRQRFSSSAGFLTFNWKFVTNESVISGFDSAFVVLDGQLFTLVRQVNTAQDLDTTNKPSTFNAGTPYNAGVVALSAGEHTLGFGAYDTSDNMVSSGLVIDNVVLIDLTLVIGLGDIDLGILQTATRDVGGRLFNLRTQGAQPQPLNIGLAASSSAGKEVAGKEPIPPRGPCVEFFAQGDFSTTDRKDTGAALGYGSWTEAATAGVECSLSDTVTAGLALGYVHNQTNANNDAGDLYVDGLAVSTYASWSRNDLYVDGLYSFGHLENRIRRNIPSGTATARTDSKGHAVQLNAGYSFLKYPGIVSGPIASMKYAHGDIDAFTDSAGLSVASQSYDSLISEFGWQASFPMKTRRGRVTPQVHASWGHEYLNKSKTIGTTFAGLTALVSTPEPRTDYAAIGCGVLAEFGERFSVLLDYEANLSRNQTTHFVELRAGFKF
jgi:uncharacterized protein YhjY with autotransporter beta-barrel domain